MLAIAAVLNIVLDLWFVIGLHMSVEGAAIATVIAQAFSGIALTVYGRWVEKIRLFSKMPEEASLVLTMISLGTRVVLAYVMAPVVGVRGIWSAIPIGWVLADVTGLVYMVKMRERK